MTPEETAAILRYVATDERFKADARGLREAADLIDRQAKRLADCESELAEARDYNLELQSLYNTDQLGCEKLQAKVERLAKALEAARNGVDKLVNDVLEEAVNALLEWRPSGGTQEYKKGYAAAVDDCAEVIRSLKSTEGGI